ncbi:hypothetical protein VR45_38545 [Streptomyces sp. NRRL S-495]|nr:hypothetical protein VR45_38545 [Streptomyces sp. NRRL S-495]
MEQCLLERHFAPQGPELRRNAGPLLSGCLSRPAQQEGHYFFIASIRLLDGTPPTSRARPPAPAPDAQEPQFHQAASPHYGAGPHD